ncbi:hypothetical protein PEC301875_24020 [Pectobacterium carotovorum subsp. carotovorum]|nr:hypothetical protein PEC301875_24020 [Pectobacterium carotovorum subsp. carotovorum]
MKQEKKPAMKLQLFSRFTNLVQWCYAPLIQRLPKSVGPTLSRFLVVSQQAKVKYGDKSNGPSTNTSY